MATETMVNAAKPVEQKPEKKKKQKKMLDLSQQQARAGWLFIYRFIGARWLSGSGGSTTSVGSVFR